MLDLQRGALACHRGALICNHVALTCHRFLGLINNVNIIVVMKDLLFLKIIVKSIEFKVFSNCVFSFSTC